MNKISLAITTYNRVEMTIKSFERVLDDERIDDIIIVDDHSLPEMYQKLSAKIDELMNPKIHLVRNEVNLGMSLNKKESVSFCKNNFVVLLDSDNVIDKEYLEAIPDKLDNDYIYMPSFARPTFNYYEFAGIEFDRQTIKPYIGKSNFGALLNTCNYLVHRDTYLKNYKHNPDILEADTISHAYNHLSNGGKFYVVPNMEYDHLVHPNSGFMRHVHKNMADAMALEKKIFWL